MNINLNTLDCRASKIIKNDTNFLGNENPILNFYVGIWVGGHPPANVSHGSKGAQEKFTSFDAHDIPAAGRGKSSIWKTAQKFNFTGIEIVCVEPILRKSMKINYSDYYKHIVFNVNHSHVKLWNMNDLAVFLKNHKHLSNKKIKYYFNVEKLICYNHLSLGFSYMSKTHQYCDLDLRLISLLRHLVTDTSGTLWSIATFFITIVSYY